jgi:hypothetical protein
MHEAQRQYQSLTGGLNACDDSPDTIDLEYFAGGVFCKQENMVYQSKSRH